MHDFEFESDHENNNHIPFPVGSRVSPVDRNNIGIVTVVEGDRRHVWFRARDGVEVTKGFHVDELQQPHGPSGAGGADASKPRKFKLTTTKELLAFPSPVWLVRDMISLGDVVVLFGDPGTFKTFLALLLCLSIATGESFAGRATLVGRIVYVAGEGNPRRMRLRFKAMTERGSGGLVVLSKPLEQNFYMVFDVVHLLREGDVVGFVQSITETIPEDDVRIIVLDTLSVSVAGGDENSAKDMSAAIEAAKQIRDRTGATVLLLHHCGRETKGHARGSSAIDGNVDGMLSVEREQGRENVIRIRNPKHRDGPVAEDLLYEFTQVDVETGPDGAPLTSGILTFLGAAGRPKAADKDQVDPKKVRKALEELGKVAPDGLTRKNLMEATSIRSEGTMQDVIDHLMSVHGVTREKVGQPFVYYMKQEAEGA